MASAGKKYRSVQELWRCRMFYALTSKRCYKSAMPLEKAYAIIREESGTHFDPAVVEAFFAVTADIEEREKLNKVI